MIDISQYKKIRTATEEYFKKFATLTCPAFQGYKIHFTSEGFNHLIFKGDRKERDKDVQIMKFKLFPKAVEIIRMSTTHQEYNEELITILKKKHKKTVYESTLAKYWGLVAIIDSFRVKVIIRQIGNGQKHFWSVIPAWTKSYYKEIKLISNFKGNLSDD